MDLNERKKLVLKAIVDTYIEKCEPVGSKSLVESYNIELSPATIRNTMSELEQLGLLEQPYTSAGRIPSSLGYRVYVDNLMQNYMLTTNEIREINENLNLKISRLDKILEQAGKIMSALTHLMSVTMTPKADYIKILKFEIVYLDQNNFLLVLLTSINIVKTKHLFTKYEIAQNVVQFLCEVLNENLVGIDINTLPLPIILNMESKMGTYSNLISPFLKIIYEAITEINNSHIYIDGLTNLLGMPEYNDIERTKNLINMIEDKAGLVKILSESKSDKLNIFIGKENTITESGDSSLIFKTFMLGGKAVGSIGVIGPKRMDYSKVIAKLEYFSKNLSEVFSNDTNESSSSFNTFDDTDFIQGEK